MSLASLMIHRVDILSPGVKTSRAGDVTYSWDNPARIASRAWFSPNRSFENNDPLNTSGQNEVVFFLPAGTPVTLSSRIQWKTRTYEVIGPPREQWTPRGEHHLEVTCKEFEHDG